MQRLKIAVLAATLSIAWAGCAASPPGAGARDPFGVDIRIRLSKRAAEELRRRKEGMIVSATYFGDPLPSAQHHANPIGQIDLGQASLPVAGVSGPAHVSGGAVVRERLGWLKGPPMVNVNVFTARRSGPDNLISCDFIDGAVERVTAQPITLNCALITEGRDTKVYPR